MNGLTILTFCTLAVFAGPAMAQTVDGETPAEETVCDILDGRAWGLCNAYCEAMDCDSAVPNANRQACDRVKGKFASLGQGDLPCEPVICPCGPADNFIGLFTDLPDGTLFDCEKDGGGGIYAPSLALVANPFGIRSPRFSALHNFPFGGAVRCSAFDAGGAPIVEIDTLTEEEYEACVIEVRSVADQIGVACPL